MNENSRLPSSARIIAILFLIGAIPEALPYGYYVLLRWVVTASAIVVIIRDYADGRTFWVVVFGLIALLFNPFVPIYLNKGTWVVIDMATIVLFALSYFMTKPDKIKET